MQIFKKENFSLLFQSYFSSPPVQFAFPAQRTNLQFLIERSSSSSLVLQFVIIRMRSKVERQWEKVVQQQSRNEKERKNFNEQ
jgi:hypothetical protein